MVFLVNAMFCQFLLCSLYPFDNLPGLSFKFSEVFLWAGGETSLGKRGGDSISHYEARRQRSRTPTLILP